MRFPGRHRSPLALPRSHGPDIYRIVQEDGAIEEIPAVIFQARYHVDNAIRILDEEYDGIDVTLPYFTHFNMEFSGNKIGSRDMLPRIVQQGYFRSPSDEVLPVLSMNNILYGVITSKREHVPYMALHDEVFHYSMTHIKNISELESAILRRYRVSMPLLSDDEILRRGVGISTLRLE